MGKNKEGFIMVMDPEETFLEEELTTTTRRKAPETASEDKAMEL